ncbi:MAG: hypothetical protein LBG04_01045 [Holosporaceae bacterium]|nr:hypothetical protein [Holosporaceae bacterium]
MRSFEYMELDECSLMVLEKIEKDLMTGKIQNVDKAYVNLEVSKLIVTEKVKKDVIRYVNDRIQIRKKVVSQKSGWWRKPDDESMEEKFKDYYHDKEYYRYR